MHVKTFSLKFLCVNHGEITSSLWAAVASPKLHNPSFARFLGAADFVCFELSKPWIRMWLCAGVPVGSVTAGSLAVPMHQIIHTFLLSLFLCPLLWFQRLFISQEWLHLPCRITFNLPKARTSNLFSNKWIATVLHTPSAITEINTRSFQHFFKEMEFCSNISIKICFIAKQSGKKPTLLFFFWIYTGAKSPFFHGGNHFNRKCSFMKRCRTGEQS